MPGLSPLLHLSIHPSSTDPLTRFQSHTGRLVSAATSQAGNRVGIVDLRVGCGVAEASVHAWRAAGHFDSRKAGRMSVFIGWFCVFVLR